MVLFAQKAANITLRNATLYTGNATVVEIQDSKNITIDHINTKPTDVLIRINGNRSKDIQLLNTDSSKAKKEFELGDGVSAKVVLKKKK